MLVFPPIFCHKYEKHLIIICSWLWALFMEKQSLMFKTAILHILMAHCLSKYDSHPCEDFPNYDLKSSIKPIQRTGGYYKANYILTPI